MRILTLVAVLLFIMFTANVPQASIVANITLNGGAYTNGDYFYNGPVTTEIAFDHYPVEELGDTASYSYTNAFFRITSTGSTQLSLRAYNENLYNAWVGVLTNNKMDVISGSAIQNGGGGGGGAIEPNLLFGLTREQAISSGRFDLSGFSIADILLTIDVWYYTRDIYEGIYSHIKIDVSDSFNPVPIPGAVWLLGSGLFGLLGIKNIRRWPLRGRTTQSVMLSLLFLFATEMAIAAPVLDIYHWYNDPQIQAGSWTETFVGGGKSKAGNIYASSSTDGYQWVISNLTLTQAPVLTGSGFESNYHYEDYRSYYTGGTLTLNANATNPEPWFGKGDTSYTAPVQMTVASRYYSNIWGQTGWYWSFQITGTFSEYPVNVLWQNSMYSYPEGYYWYSLDSNSESGELRWPQFILSQANPVPIPAGAWLLGSGLIGLIGLKSVKRTSAYRIQ